MTRKNDNNSNDVGNEKKFEVIVKNLRKQNYNRINSTYKGPTSYRKIDSQILLQNRHCMLFVLL